MTVNTKVRVLSDSKSSPRAKGMTLDVQGRESNAARRCGSLYYEFMASTRTQDREQQMREMIDEMCLSPNDNLQMRQQ